MLERKVKKQRKKRKKEEQKVKKQTENETETIEEPGPVFPGLAPFVFVVFVLYDPVTYSLISPQSICLKSTMAKRAVRKSDPAWETMTP